MGQHTCSKAFLLVFAIIILLLSIALIVLGILAEVSNLFDFQLPKQGKTDPEEWVHIAGYIFIGAGSAMLLTSIAGIYGALKIKKCLMFIYWITLLVFFLFFLGLTIAFPVILDPLYSEIKSSNCQQNTSSKFKAIHEMMYQTNNLFVQLSENVYCLQYKNFVPPEKCECYLENPAIWTTRFPEFSNTYEYNSLYSENSITKVDQCPNFTQVLEQQGVLQDYQDYAGFAGYIEETFDCTGVCQGSLFYMFSNINRGVPSTYVSQEVMGGCKQKFVSFVSSYRDYTFISVLVALILVTLNHFILFYLCCQQRRNPDYLNSYLELAGGGGNRHVY